jgi:uridine phosphorylase
VPGFFFLALPGILSNLNRMTSPVDILVCFAVKEEAGPFRKLVARRTDVSILVHGMGAANAKRHFSAAIAQHRPVMVLTCGFAGGLDPQLSRGEVVYSADEGFPLGAAFARAGARPASFHCAGKVAITALEKSSLRQTTGADAVEMESGVIRRISSEKGIPSATIRVISDASGDDLPLDFNALMTPDLRMDWPRLALAILKNPARIGDLMKFQKQTSAAAAKLASTLVKVISR